MADREKVIKGLMHCHCRCGCNSNCPYFPILVDHNGGVDACTSQLADDALSLLREQEARVMTLEEVEALPYGYVLIETDKKDSLRWVDALLFCKNTNFSFDFITLEGRARLLGTDYNKEWRCWTSRPTEEQRKTVEWE